MRVKFFAKASEFRKWLSQNHDKTDELWVGYHKKVTGIPSITWSESVDEALCFGWIDGLRKSIDEENYRIRFTPRRTGSTWSDVNIRRLKKLKKQGKVEPSGIRAYENRKRTSAFGSVQRRNLKLSRQFEDRLKSNKKAWEYFNALAPSYRKLSIGWIMSAKKEETRLRRLGTLVESSENGQLVPPLIVSRKKGD